MLLWCHPVNNKRLNWIQAKNVPQQYVNIKSSHVKDPFNDCFCDVTLCVTGGVYSVGRIVSIRRLNKEYNFIFWKDWRLKSSSQMLISYFEKTDISKALLICFHKKSQHRRRRKMERKTFHYTLPTKMSFLLYYYYVILVFFELHISVISQNRIVHADCSANASLMPF